MSYLSGVPVAVPAATSVVRGIGKVLGGIFGGGGPSYANAVKRVQSALKYGLQGGTAPKRYAPGGTETLPPVQYLANVAAGSKYSEARQAATLALQRLASEAPEPVRTQAVQAMASASPATAVPPDEGGSATGGTGTGTALLVAAVGAAVLLSRRRRR
jgi:hypothetical protein